MWLESECGSKGLDRNKIEVIALGVLLEGETIYLVHAKVGRSWSQNVCSGSESNGWQRGI